MSANFEEIRSHCLIQTVWAFQTILNYTNIKKKTISIFDGQYSDITHKL